MSKVDIPEGAPKHICADLSRVVGQEDYANERYREQLDQKVEAGEITEGDAARDFAELPVFKEELLDFCSRRCDMGNCAMKGFGKELVGVEDRDSLSAEDREKLEFFRSVDTTRACAEMAAGIFLM